MLLLKIIELVNIVMAFQLTFFAVYLFFQKNRHLSIMYLALFLTSKALVYLSNILVHSFHVSAMLSAFTYSFMFLLNPLTFFYTKSLIDRHYRFKTKILIHAIPFLLVLCKAFIVCFTDYSFKVDIQLFLLLVFMVQVIVYIPKSIAIAKKQENNKDNNEQDEIKLRWLKVLLYGLLLLWLVYGSSIIAGYLFKFNSLGLTLFVELFFLAILLGLIYVALFNGTLFQFDLRKNKYHYSKLSDPKKTVILEKLEQQMSVSQLYLDSKLSLEKLANSLSISTRELSQLINENKAMNFNEYVNSFRLQHSMKLLTDDTKKSIQEVLFESGFNSSSVFYALFYKHTSKTPKQYRELNA